MLVPRGLILPFYALCVIHWVTAEHEKESPFTTVVRKTLISTARSCMTHVNASEVDLEDLRKEPPYPEKAACIVKCLLEKIGIVKNNKYSKMGFMTVVSPLVFTNKKKLEHMKTVSENCEKELLKTWLTNNKNECVKINEFASQLHQTQ